MDASSANAANPMAGVDGGYHQHGASVSALVALSSSHAGAGVGATGVSGGATNTKYALQRAFLRNQPALRRIVDFAVRLPTIGSDWSRHAHLVHVSVPVSLNI